MENEKLLLKWMNSNASQVVPKYIDNALLGDKEFIMQVIDNVELKSFDLLKQLSPELRKDKEVVINALNHELARPQSIDPALLADKDVALALVAKGGHNLKYVSDELKDDKEVVLTATSKYSNALAFASDRLKADRDVVLFALSHPVLDSGYYEVWAPRELLTYFVAPAFKDDKEVLVTAVRNGKTGYLNDPENHLYASLPSKWKADRDVAQAALAASHQILDSIPKEVYADKEFALKAIDEWNTRNPRASIDFLTSRIKPLLGDKEVVMKMLSQHGGRLYDCSREMKKDREVVITAINYNPGAYGSADFSLRIDDEIILLAAEKGFSNVSHAQFIKENGEYYIHLMIDADKVASDFKMGAALAAGISSMNGVKITMDDIMKDSGIDSIKDVDKKIKIDEEFIINAMKNDRRLRATKKISKEVIEDRTTKLYSTYTKTQITLDDKDVIFTRDFTLYSIKYSLFYGRMFQNIKDEYKVDKEIITEAVKKDYGSLQYVPLEVRNDKEFMLSLLKIDSRVYTYIPDALKDDTDVALTMIDADPCSFENMSSKVRGNKEIALFALAKDGALLKCLPSALKNKTEIYEFALENNTCAFISAPISYRNDRDIVLKAVTRDGSTYRFASSELKKDRVIVLTAVNNYGLALRFAPEEYKRDKEIVLAAVKNNPEAIRYAYGELQFDNDIKALIMISE